MPMCLCLCRLVHICTPFHAHIPTTESRKSRVYFKRKEKRWLASTAVESGTREHPTRAAASTDRTVTVLASSPLLPPRRKQPASSNVPSTTVTNEHRQELLRRDKNVAQQQPLPRIGGL